MIAKTVGAALLALTLATTAFAEQDGPKHQGKHKPTFAEFDLDSDGYISAEEFNRGHAERFAKFAAEGRKMKKAGKLPEMFSRIDTDGDGRLSSEEFAAHHKDGCGRERAT